MPIVSNIATPYVPCLFTYVGSMVDAPKTLHDLRRIEGAVRVTCRACGSVEVFDREQLIFDRTFHRRSCDWGAVRQDLICRSPTCGSRDADVDGMPFSDNEPELRHQRTSMLVMNLALTVLENASRGAKTGTFDRSAVRLALRILHPHLRDKNMLTELWQHLAEKTDEIGAHPHIVLRWIINKLVARGYAVWAELR